MELAIKLLDKTTNGNSYFETELKLVSERTTLREIIEKRIKQEVERFNSSRPKFFNGLVQPLDAEKQLNGYRFKKPRQISYQKQIEQAINAFQTNGYFVLLDDTQITDLDTPILLKENSELSFIKLVPLVGG